MHVNIGTMGDLDASAKSSLKGVFNTLSVSFVSDPLQYSRFFPHVVAEGGEGEFATFELTCFQYLQPSRVLRKERCVTNQL